MIQVCAHAPVLAIVIKPFAYCNLRNIKEPKTRVSLYASRQRECEACRHINYPRLNSNVSICHTMGRF